MTLPRHRLQPALLAIALVVPAAVLLTALDQTPPRPAPSTSATPIPRQTPAATTPRGPDTTTPPAPAAANITPDDWTTLQRNVTKLVADQAGLSEEVHATLHIVQAPGWWGETIVQWLVFGAVAILIGNAWARVNVAREATSQMKATADDAARSTELTQLKQEVRQLKEELGRRQAALEKVHQDILTTFRLDNLK